MSDDFEYLANVNLVTEAEWTTRRNDLRDNDIEVQTLYGQQRHVIVKSKRAEDYLQTQQPWVLSFEPLHAQNMMGQHFNVTCEEQRQL